MTRRPSAVRPRRLLLLLVVSCAHRAAAPPPPEHVPVYLPRAPLTPKAGAAASTAAMGSVIRPLAPVSMPGAPVHAGGLTDAHVDARRWRPAKAVHQSLEDTTDPADFIRRLRRHVKKRHRLPKLDVHLAPPPPKPPPPRRLPPPIPLSKAPRPMPLPSKPHLAPAPQPVSPAPSGLAPISVPAPAPTASAPSPKSPPECPAGTTPLPVTLCVRHSSPVTTSSCDAQPIFNVGTGLLLLDGTASSIRSFSSVVAGPISDSVVTLATPYNGSSACGIVPCLLDRTCADEDDNSEAFEVLDPCGNALNGSVFLRTSRSWARDVRTGDTIRIGGTDYVVETPRDDHVVTLSHPYHGPSRNCSIVLRRSASAAAEAGLAPLPCCLSTRAGSRNATATPKLFAALNAGDVVRVRGTTLQIVELHPATAAAAAAVLLSTPWDGPTCEAMVARSVASCTALPGRVALVHGSSRVATDTDFRDNLQLGDIVAFESLPPGTFRVVNSTVTAWDFELNEEPYPAKDPHSAVPDDETEQDSPLVHAYKCAQKAAPTCEKIGSCQIVLTPGSTVGRTPCDLSTAVDVGDPVRVKPRASSCYCHFRSARPSYDPLTSPACLSRLL